MDGSWDTYLASYPPQIFFCRGGWHYKGEGAWDWDNWTHSLMGNSRKYPYPTTDGFHVLTPLVFGNSKMRYPPMPSEFHNREPPLPFRISGFSGKYIFDFSNAYMNEWTWIYASSGLWSSGARRKTLLFSDKKNLPLVARLWKLLLSPNLAIIINTIYGSFTPLCFLVLFWRLQSRIARIQTVKIFQRSNLGQTVESCCVLLYVM